MLENDIHTSISGIPLHCDIKWNDDFPSVVYIRKNIKHRHFTGSPVCTNVKKQTAHIIIIIILLSLKFECPISNSCWSSWFS